MRGTPLEALKFNSKLHYEEYARWMRARGGGPTPLALLPALGRVVPNYCVGFVYQTDTPIGFLSDMTSNPEMRFAPEMQEAFDALWDALEKDAKEHHIQVLKGDTKLDQVAKRAEAKGFFIFPDTYRILMKGL